MRAISIQPPSHALVPIVKIPFKGLLLTASTRVIELVPWCWASPTKGDRKSFQKRTFEYLEWCHGKEMDKALRTDRETLGAVSSFGAEEPKPTMGGVGGGGSLPHFGIKFSKHTHTHTRQRQLAMSLVCL